VRDIRDQLLQLCERVEIFVEPNPNASDIVPIQKALSAGYVEPLPLLLEVEGGRASLTLVLAALAGTS